jgi:hypothetical protein
MKLVTPLDMLDYGPTVVPVSGQKPLADYSTHGAPANIPSDAAIKYIRKIRERELARSLPSFSQAKAFRHSMICCTTCRFAMRTG